MKRIVLALIATAAMGSAIAQAPEAPKPRALVHADSQTVQVQGVPVAVDTSAGANAGDMVSMAAGGRATVTYANGCAVQVTSGYQILAEEPTCDTAVVATVAGKNKTMLMAGGMGAIGLAIAASARANKGRPDPGRPSSP